MIKKFKHLLAKRFVHWAVSLNNDILPPTVEIERIKRVDTIKEVPVNRYIERHELVPLKCMSAFSITMNEYDAARMRGAAIDDRINWQLEDGLLRELKNVVKATMATERQRQSFTYHYRAKLKIYLFKDDYDKITH